MPKSKVKKRMVLAPSGPWVSIACKGKRQQETGRADINFLRQYAAAERCRDEAIDLLMVSGRMNEMDLLALVCLEARQAAHFRPATTLLRGGAEHSFLNGYFGLEAAFQLGVEGVDIVSSPYHLERLELIVRGILAFTAHRLDWTIDVRTVPAPLSVLPHVVPFECDLTEQEPMKRDIERETLAGFGDQLKRWRHRKKTDFLPFPEIVRQKIPPATLARIASLPPRHLE